VKTIHVPFASCALVIGLLPAQSPDTPQSPAAPTLQSLQSLVTEHVHARQATIGAVAGEARAADPLAHDIAFARVHDAEFDASGRLIRLIVTAPPSADDEDTGARVLPADAVRWHAAHKRWLLVQPTLQWAELLPFEKPVPAKEPALKQPPVLTASALLRARCADEAPGVPVEASSRTRDGESKALVFWLAGEPQQLVVATVPHGGKNLLVPWSALRLAPAGDDTLLHLPPAALTSDAPSIEDASSPPDQATRNKIRQHFGVATPKWDRPPGESEPDKAPEPAGDKRKERDAG